MAKNIIVCCDDTGNEYGANNTNVIEMYEPVVRNQEQVAYYDPGVGTFSIFGRTLGKKMGVIMGQGFGYGLTENIEDAYLYLMDRYEPGDKVFLFGFSRGAFTARALAGMLHKVGLLQKGSNNLIPYASIWMLENAENHGLKLKEGWRDRLEGNPAGAIHESRAGFWKIWPPVTPLSLS